MLICAPRGRAQTPAIAGQRLRQLRDDIPDITRDLSSELAKGITDPKSVISRVSALAKRAQGSACIIPVLFGLSCEMSSIQQLPRKSCVLRGQASKPLSSSFRISINQTFKPGSMMNSLGNHPLPWPLSAQQHLMKTSVKETKGPQEIRYFNHLISLWIPFWSTPNWELFRAKGDKHSTQKYPRVKAALNSLGIWMLFELHFFLWFGLVGLWSKIISDMFCVLVLSACSKFKQDWTRTGMDYMI